MMVTGTMSNPTFATQEPIVANSAQVAASAYQSSSPITTKAEARTMAAAADSSTHQNRKAYGGGSNAGVEAALRAYFADAPLMVEIARCESKFRQYDAKGNVLQGIQVSEDTGVLQVNKTYHLKRAIKLGYDIDTLAGNMGYSRLLQSEQGYWPWVSSMPCWGKSPLAANFKAQYESRQAAKAQKAQLAKANADAAVTATAAAAEVASASLSPVADASALIAPASVTGAINASQSALAER